MRQIRRLDLIWQGKEIDTYEPKFLTYPVAGMSGGEKFDGIRAS